MEHNQYTNIVTPNEADFPSKHVFEQGPLVTLPVIFMHNMDRACLALCDGRSASGVTEVAQVPVDESLHSLDLVLEQGG